MRVAANQVHGLKVLAERTIQKGVDCAVSATELTTREINADYIGSGRRKTAKHAQSATFKGADLHDLLRAERGDYVGEAVKLRRNLQRLNQIVGQHKGCNSFGRGLKTQPKHKRDSGSSAAEFCEHRAEILQRRSSHFESVHYPRRVPLAAPRELLTASRNATGVGRGRGVTLGVGAGVKVGMTVGVAVGPGLGVAVGVALGVGVGVGVPPGTATPEAIPHSTSQQWLSSLSGSALRGYDRLLYTLRFRRIKKQPCVHVGGCLA